MNTKPEETKTTKPIEPPPRRTGNMLKLKTGVKAGSACANGMDS